MCRPIYALILSLAASCNAPGAGFRGAAPVAVEESGSRFLMRRAGPLVEVNRVSPEAFPRFRPTAEKAARAFAADSACDVAWVVGDQARFVMGLECPGATVPPRPRQPQAFSCTATRRPLLAEFDLDCVQP